MSTTKICTQCGAEYELSEKFCPADGSPLRFRSADDPLIGQMVADRYQILSLIGEGGMGRVYLAEHVRMGRRSAVKVINPALATTADAISRFNREAANACKINHPNVAQVYDFGEMADGTLYLAMEYIDGETLDAIVAREGPLPVGRAAQITKQVADALFAAHHLGIVHRDLKPENVMVARHLDGSDWVKVVDFGIAKTIQRDGHEGGSQTVTTAGVSLGTPEYMSPEQLAGERLDHRTDIYSLGLVLFNMLTGQLPYPKVTSKETLIRRLTWKPRTLGEALPNVEWPVALQQALDRALTPEVSDRYENVAEFGRAVVRAAEGADVAPADARAPAAAAVTTAPPIAPNDQPLDEPRLEKPILHRRAVPWMIGTAAVLGVAIVIASARSRHAEESVMTDSAASAIVVDPPSGAPAPTPPPPPAHLDSAPLRHSVRSPVSPSVSASRHARDTTSESQFTRRLSDSLRRALSRMPLGEIARLDSVLAHIGPEIDRARRAEAQRGAKLQPRHYWLSPTGDSVPAVPIPPDAPPEARAAAASREIRAHITRMRQRFTRGDMRGARQDLTAATSELASLRDFNPDPDEAVDLQRELTDGVRDLYETCFRMRADSTLPPGVRCDNFFGSGRARRPN